jgi:hypothetical protein
MQVKGRTINHTKKRVRHTLPNKQLINVPNDFIEVSAGRCGVGHSQADYLFRVDNEDCSDLERASYC